MVVNPLSQVGKLERVAFGCAVCYSEASACNEGNFMSATYAMFLPMSCCAGIPMENESNFCFCSCCCPEDSAATTFSSFSGIGILSSPLAKCTPVCTMARKKRMLRRKIGFSFSLGLSYACPGSIIASSASSLLVQMKISPKNQALNTYQAKVCNVLATLDRPVSQKK